MSMSGVSISEGVTACKSSVLQSVDIKVCLDTPPMMMGAGSMAALLWQHVEYYVMLSPTGFWML